MSHPSPPPAGQKLSVAIIVRDAAGLLSTTLDSIRAIADEIVVLDTGSTDDTVEVAREAGATVHQAAWQDDFSAARNECAKHVDGNWTLWLDAGETIDNLAALQLRQFVDERADVSKAYLLYVHRATAGPGISNEQIGQLRLVPTQVRLQFAGRVGESPLAAAVDAGINIDALECAIERSPNEADLQTRQAKATRNLRLVELSLADGEPNATILNVHAQALVELNRKDEAAAVYRQAIDLADRGSTAMLEAYYGLLTILDGQRDDRDTLMEFCLQALEVYPLDAQLLCAMGCYLLQQGRLDLAVRSYELAATHGQVDPGTWHLTDLADVAVACQSRTLQLLGEGQKSLAVLKSALTERPESVAVRRQLIDAYIKAGKGDEAIGQLDHLPDETTDRHLLREVVSGAVLVATGHPQEGLPRLRKTHEAGCHDPLCFRWLATAFLQLGKYDQAESVLDGWETCDPTSPEISSCRLALLGLRAGALAAATGGNSTAPAANPQTRTDAKSSIGAPILWPTTATGATISTPPASV